MRTLVVDYGSGNLRSVAKALEHVAPKDVEVCVSGDAADLAAADRIVLPGVGAFADCRAGLEARPGMIEALEREVRAKGKPFLGICVGMQLMAERGLEYETVPGFGWIAGEIAAIRPAPDAQGRARKVPHMGWNELAERRDHPLLAGIEAGEHVYFVHSFALSGGRADQQIAVADYGGPIVAAVGRDNLFGTQFHPEKSQKAGLRLLTNFLHWRP